jgi:hypothetical protein
MLGVIFLNEKVAMATGAVFGIIAGDGEYVRR